MALSGEDRAELGRLLASGDRRLAERAKIVLACAGGRDNRAVAAELRTTEHTVPSGVAVSSGSGWPA